MWRGVWDREGRAWFREKMGSVVAEERGLEMEREGMEGRIKEALKEEERMKGREGKGGGGWWDGECKEGEEKGGGSEEEVEGVAKREG